MSLTAISATAAGLLRVGIDYLVGCAVALNATLLDPDYAGAGPADGRHGVAHQDNGLGSVTKLLHSIHAAFLEIQVTRGERLVEQKDLMIHRRSNRELQSSRHARRVSREW
jgi:hypothetical protein